MAVSVPCPNCKSAHTVKYGKQVTPKATYQRRKCQDCGYVFNGEVIS